VSVVLRCLFIAIVSHLLLNVPGDMASTLCRRESYLGCEIALSGSFFSDFSVLILFFVVLFSLLLVIPFLLPLIFLLPPLILALQVNICM